MSDTKLATMSELDIIRQRADAIDASFIARWTEAGYRLHGKVAHKRADGLLQKAIVANGERLFFVNLWLYLYDEFRMDGDERRIGSLAEVQFNTHADQEPTFDVSLLVAESPEKVEWFFRTVYDYMQCEPYGY